MPGGQFALSCQVAVCDFTLSNEIIKIVLPACVSGNFKYAMLTHHCSNCSCINIAHAETPSSIITVDMRPAEISAKQLHIIFGYGFDQTSSNRPLVLHLTILHAFVACLQSLQFYLEAFSSVGVKLHETA